MARKRKKAAETPAAEPVEPGPDTATVPDVPAAAVIDAGRDSRPATLAPADPVKPPASPPVSLVLMHEMPLGNGTRPAGMVLAEFRPAPGVDLVEVSTAMLNPGRIQLQTR